MFEIMEKRQLSPEIYSFKVKAPRVANKALPGQFIILILDEEGERIPLTICDVDKDEGSVFLVVQALGVSTRELGKVKPGDKLHAFLGPLGKPSKFVDEDIGELRKKRVLLVGGGLGIAPLIPQAKWLKKNKVDFEVVIGARSKELIILEDKFRELTDEVFVSTDDGSYGFHGMAVDAVKELVVNQGKHYDLAVIIGPMVMMKYTSRTAINLGIDSIVSMNSIMVDGTGMCGACRVNLGGEIKFACVDGPEFDASLIDFDEALRRQSQYRIEEAEKLKNHQPCDLSRGMRDGQI